MMRLMLRVTLILFITGYAVIIPASMAEDKKLTLTSRALAKGCVLSLGKVSLTLKVKQHSIINTKGSAIFLPAEWVILNRLLKFA